MNHQDACVVRFRDDILLGVFTWNKQQLMFLHLIVLTVDFSWFFLTKMLTVMLFIKDEDKHANRIKKTLMFEMLDS